MIKQILKIGLPIAVLVVAGLFIFQNRNQSKPNFPKRSYVSQSGRRGPASANKEVVPAKVIYKMKEDASADQLAAFKKVADDFDLKTERTLVMGKLISAKKHRQESMNEDDLAQALIETGAVEFAEPDQVIEPAYVPNDVYINEQWHHTPIRSFEAWNTTRGASTLLVANCDTGVSATHPDLASNLRPEYNAVDRVLKTEVPLNSHGTVTAGAFVGVINNATGIAGVAGAVKLLPIRISNTPDGGSTFEIMAHCIEYAANQGAKVVNVSYSGAFSYTIDTAAQYLRTKGGLLVMASGNEGTDNSAHPDFASFIIVGAADRSGIKASFSNYGTPIDLIAPGVDIFTSDMGGSYVYASGTSLSTPLVSGAAALIYSLSPQFTPTQVEQFLLKSAKPTSAGTAIDGQGQLDVAAALAMAKASLATPTPSPIPTPTPTPTATPTPAPKTVSFAATADSMAKNNYPTTTYGAATVLRSALTPDSYIYLKFSVVNFSGTVKSAKLRMYVTNGTVNGPKLYRTSTSTWAESTLNWNNKPAYSTTILGDKAAVAVSTWIEYDVTSVVRGNGVFSFLLKPDSSDGFEIRSRETTSKPTLIITY